MDFRIDEILLDVFAMPSLAIHFHAGLEITQLYRNSAVFWAGGSQREKA
jgi:hypothetical protein